LLASDEKHKAASTVQCTSNTTTQCVVLCRNIIDKESVSKRAKRRYYIARVPGNPREHYYIDTAEKVQKIEEKIQMTSLNFFCPLCSGGWGYVLRLVELGTDVGWVTFATCPGLHIILKSFM
jgi:hypothetical protein